MRVVEAMTKRVTTVTQSTSVTAALRLQYMQGIRHLPVVDDDGGLIGIVSDRDLAPAMRSAPAAWAREPTVGTVMTTGVRWTRPGDDLVAATRQMLAWRISALPVVEEERVVGILTTTDCLHALLELADDRGAADNGVSNAPSVTGADA